MKGLVTAITFAAVLLMLCAFGRPKQPAPEAGMKRAAKMHPLTLPHPDKLPTRNYACDRVPPASSLKDLVRDSDTIAVGTVTSILLQAPALRDAEDYTLPPQTVFSFDVERVYRGGPGDGSTIKIVCPWGADIDGIHYMVPGEPLPELGCRYLLFLKQPDPARWAELGYVGASIGAVDGKTMELDEFLVNPGEPMLLLCGGMTYPASDAYTRDEAVGFSSGDQIVNLPESIILARVATAVEEILLEDHPSPRALQAH